MQLNQEQHELKLSEELIVKSPKNLEELHFFSKIENTAHLFLFCEQNLLETKNGKAREYYLQTISKKLKATNKQNLSINTIDFYISNFLAKSSILANENFNSEKCRKFVAEIQVLLTHWLYQHEIDNFFDEYSDEYLFSWEEDDILNYLEVFNESMRENYCFMQRDMALFEDLLNKRGDEDKIITFLIGCIEKDNTNSRAIKILFDTLLWVNKDIIIDKKYSDIALGALSNNDDPNPLFIFIVNTFNRSLQHPLGKQNYPPSVYEIRSQLINIVIKDELIENLIKYIAKTQNYELGYVLYNLLANKYIKLFVNGIYFPQYLRALFDLIEYASSYKTSAYFDPSSLSKSLMFFRGGPDSLYQMISEKLEWVIKNAENDDYDILTKKFYAYFTLIFKGMPFLGGHFIHNPIFAQPKVIECSLNAFRKCVFMTSLNDSIDFLNFFTQVLDIDSTLFTPQSFVYYIECNELLIHICTDDLLVRYFQAFFPNLIEHVKNFENCEQKLSIFNALNSLFDNNNFPCLVYKNDKLYFLDLIYDFIQSMDENYILLAEKLFLAFNASKNSGNDVKEIISNITSIINSFQVDDSNMFQISQIISFLPENYIERNEVTQNVIQKLLSCDQDLLLNSKYYIKLLIKYLKFYSFDKIYQHLVENPDLELFSMIVQLSTDDIDPDQEQVLTNALIFSNIIIDLMKKITEERNPSSDCIEYLNSSINFCVPLINYMDLEKLSTFIDIMIKLIHSFALKIEVLQKFFIFFEQNDDDRFSENAWYILDNIKTVFSQNTSDVDSINFDGLALEILRFMHFMFSLDSDRGIFLFSQIKPENFYVSRLMKFLVHQSKHPFSDKIFSSYVIKIRDGCKCLRRSLF